MSRVYNFSAGPAVLPEEVLQEAADEMLDYRGCGMSVMEMSHRSKVFDDIIKDAEKDLRELMNIPDNYKVMFLQGGDSSTPGLLIQTKEKKKESVSLVQPTIYYETKKAYYIDDESVNAGDVVIQSDSSSTYTIGDDVGSLTGVYNINKGYAVFKQISILSQNDNYSIVDPKTDYGIALYDHIALVECWHYFHLL